ncbi:hypothetical protein BC828DRAFT_371594 [Blastocladiella britannica]|nr:hypothetical protein BC828DRAFT_371594 [Blastocladiella britannica]
MHYFLRMMHEAQENEFRFLPAVVPYTRGVCPQQQQQHHRGGSDNGMVELLETTAPPTGPAGRRSPARDGGAMGRRTTTPSATSPDRRRSSTATGGGRTSALDPRSMTIDELELALGMQQVRHSDPASMVSTIHGEFLQDQGKLHDGLEEELDRFERQRKTVISHKYKAFSIGVNGICSTDLEHMRSAAATHRLQERNKTLRLHPWYNELLRIVFGSTSPSSNTPGGLETPGGAPVPFPTTTTTQGSPGRNGGTPRKAICEAERILLVRVRSLLGDNVPIDKVEFIRMLKLVPRAEFMTDSVQKVVKFLRQRMGISELEYLDAIELSGHMMSAIPGSAQGRSSVGSTGGAGGGGDADESDAGMDADDGGAHAAAEAELMAGVDSAMGMTGPGAGTISLIRGASRGNGGGYGGAGGGGGFGGTSPDRKRTLSLAPVGSGHRGGRKS